MRHHVRRKDREIEDPAKLAGVLREARYVTLALSRENVPYLVSLSHSYDADAGCLYFHCAAEGKKLDFMKANPRVWGQAILDRGYVDGECNHLFVTVMFDGKVELVEDMAGKRRIMSHMFAGQQRSPAAGGGGDVDPHVARIRQDGELKGTTVGRILLGQLTGKHSKGAEY